jgi:hypothetical protein
MTHDASIAAAIAWVRERLVDCPACQAARELRRAVGRDLKQHLELCAGAGDEDNSCDECIAAQDRHAETCWQEIRTIGAHPHRASTRSKENR